MIFQKIVVLVALFCVSLEQANSARLRNAVVDFSPEGETFRGNLHINGKAYPLTLQRAVDSVFAPSFRLTETIRAPSGKIILRHIPLSKPVSDLERNIYVDEDAHAAFHMEHVDGEMRLQGIMDNIHISHDGLGHVAAIHDFPSMDIKSDYRSTGLTWSKDNNSVEDRAVAVANPELYITIDNQHFTDLGRDEERIPAYLAILIRGANNRYKTVSDPSIKFKIVGSTIFKSEDVQPFVENSRGKGDQGKCDMDIVLKGFSEYMYNLRKTNGDLPQHDLAPLLSGEEYGGVWGLAWLAGACQDDNYRKRSWRTSVNRDDKGAWTGVFTLAHELAHNMGAPHDGEKSQPGENPPYDTTKCAWKDGFIMSYLWHDKNRLTFSRCSKSYMKAYINSGKAECVKTDDASEVWEEVPNDPGYYISMEDQCKKRLISYGENSCTTGTVDATKTPDQLCTQLSCLCKDKRWTVEMQDRPMDGTPCGSAGGRCKEGKCGLLGL